MAMVAKRHRMCHVQLTTTADMSARLVQTAVSHAEQGTMNWKKNPGGLNSSGPFNKVLD